MHRHCSPLLRRFHAQVTGSTVTILLLLPLAWTVRSVTAQPAPQPLQVTNQLMTPAPTQPPPTATAPASPTPMIPAGISVTPQLPSTLQIPASGLPDNLGFLLSIRSSRAAGLVITITLEAPLVPALGTVYPYVISLDVVANTQMNYTGFGASLTVPPGTPPGTRGCARVDWTALGIGTEQTATTCTVVVDSYGRGAPTATTGPSPTPSSPPTAPCYQAAIAALTKQGAPYSQGGHHPDDPSGPDGRPLPRTGPNAFDCSGLVWWAYMQAGVSIGTTTAGQINDGVAIDCTLADLRGADTRCWTLGDLIFLAYPGGQHVALYVGEGLFMDCYNHKTGCMLHDVSQDAFYRKHFSQARRIVSGCEGLTNDPGVPVSPPLPGSPESDSRCQPDGPNWTEDTGVGYSRGCGPPVAPPGPNSAGTKLRQFAGIVGWLGESGARSPPGPAGVHLHLGLDAGSQTDMCQWPNQAPGFPTGEPPPGGTTCITTWADPLQFFPQANGDSLTLVDGTAVPVPRGQPGDSTLSDAMLQLPPPGHPAGLAFAAEQADTAPGGAWWSPGNADRAQGARCPLGGPTVNTWFTWLLAFLLPWLFGC